MTDDLARYNSKAWDAKVDAGWEWTLPVDTKEIDDAKKGIFSLYLTPSKPVPADWIGNIAGKNVLGLASAGGQQCPLMAAAGAIVTVFDNSPKQLAQDKYVAVRNGLKLSLEQGDMRDLSRFQDSSFDLIFHPVSNTYVDDPRPVWKEAFRVLKKGGVLLSGFTNPLIYLFNDEKELKVENKLPYSQRDHLKPHELEKHMASNNPLEFSHTLTTQIGGQLDAGFVLTAFFEDNDISGENLIDDYTATYIATKAVKL